MTKLLRSILHFLSTKKTLSAGNLARLQASRADMKRFRRAVNDSFNRAHVRLPSAVGSSMGMADLITKQHFLLTVVTLCHDSNPPS